MVRRERLAFERDSMDAAVSALETVGVPDVAAHAGGPDGPDFVLSIGDQRLIGEVKAVVTEGSVRPLITQLKRRRAPVLLVADRIADGAKDRLAAAGINYLDRRGDLRLVAPPVFVHTQVPASAYERGGTDPLSSQVAKEAAIACLLAPHEPHGVREIAARIGRVPSAVSSAMAGLRRAGLLTSRGEALVPDLFYELSTRWHREPVALQRAPDPSNERELGLGVARLDGLGWALTDTRAAAAWGIPIVASGDYPPDFYVPSSNGALRRAQMLLGIADNPERRACTVTEAPVRFACWERSRRVNEPWPVANHIVVALDIAADRARGLEALEQWNPTEFDRAW